MRTLSYSVHVHVRVRPVTHTVNCEYFDVKIFSDSIAYAKIKHTKYMRNINDNAVQDCLSETRKLMA